jgi:hypothetical protein
MWVECVDDGEVVLDALSILRVRGHPVSGRRCSNIWQKGVAGPYFLI